MFQFKKLDF